MHPVGNSQNHLLYFLQKILDKVPFGLVRPADGEFQILIDKTLTNCDNWTYKQGGRLRQDMYNSLSKAIPNLYIGIPCDCCNVDMKNTYINTFNLNPRRRTYANIFCNANWKNFISFLRNYPDGFSLVTSGPQSCDLPIKDRYIIDQYLVNKWDDVGSQETDNLMEWVSTKKNELICFSAGPLSKVWIPLLMNKYPNNTYLDVGSSLDIFTKGETNRFYTKEGDGLTNLVCNFIN
jgi:hypothetical protein